MKVDTKKLVSTGLLIALGMVLPSFFHMFGAGTVMLPMHIPVLICGLACGMPYGAACGVILPLLSSVTTGMPPIFPTAPAMAFELCTYGLICGLLFYKARMNIYVSLLGGMLAGRVVSGIANAILMGVADRPYGVESFLMAAFVTGLPGIIIQLVFVPVIVLLLIKARIVQGPEKRIRSAAKANV